MSALVPQTTLDRFFPAMFADDRETLATLLTEGVVWHAPPFARERFGDPVGRQAVIDFLCGAGDEFYQPGSFSIERELQAVEEDRAIVLAILRATSARGEPYENRYAFGFRFRDGQIDEAWELLDSIHFERQIGKALA